MNDWRKPCEHGLFTPHKMSEWDGTRGVCSGGSLVTAADLEALGEIVEWCEFHRAPLGDHTGSHCRSTQQLLIPIPGQAE